MSFVVSDTTPLNYLILIGHIEVLPRLFGKVLVPPAVIREMSHPRTPPAVAAWARNPPSWVEIKAPRTPSRLEIGAGEDEAITLAVELGDAAVLVDDRKARCVAQSCGLVTIGTLAILDLADEAGWLDFQDALELLQGTTFHIDGVVADGLLQRWRSRRKASG